MIPAEIAAHRGVKIVHTFEELASTPFSGEINALCWPRTLPGDFAEVLAALNPPPGIHPLDDAQLAALPLSPAGRKAAATMLEDAHKLRDLALFPEINSIGGYIREKDDGVIRTDVYSWHTDSATCEADTWLCTYHGAPTEILHHDHAIRRADDSTTRAALLRDFGGQDGPEFAEYLAENCYDLHFTPLPHAQPLSLGTGHLWRLALAWPGVRVPPCIHRAPETLPGDTPRLLLIS